MFLSGSTNLHCFAIVPLWSKWKHLLGFNLNTLLLGNSYHFLVLFFTFMFITVFKILPSRLFYLNSLFSLCLTLLLFIILSKDYDLCKYACPKHQKRIPRSPQCKTKQRGKFSLFRTGYLGEYKTCCKELKIGKLLFIIFIGQFFYSLCLVHLQLKEDAKLTAASVFWNKMTHNLDIYL